MTFAVVYSAGRTGSHLICNNLISSSLKITEYPFIGTKPSIIHCHNPLYKPPQKTICIISKRRNIFDALMSRAIANITNEHYVYSDNNVPQAPVTITAEELHKSYVQYVSFYKLIKLNNRKIFEIYYEDLIDDPYCLFSHLGIHKKINLLITHKSPYDYKKIIINHNELFEAYQRFLQINVSEQEVESVRQTYINYARQHGNCLS